MLFLSKNFTLGEFTYSETANKYGVLNEPTATHLNTLQHTCLYCLEILRDLLNKKFAGNIYNNKKVLKAIINITSGYRSKEVNQLLKKQGYKPSETSQHCTGEAADIEVVLIFEDGTKNALPYNETYELIKYWVKITGELSVDQCIKEKQGDKTWVHISHSAWGRTKDRRQFLIFDGKNYILDKNFQS